MKILGEENKHTNVPLSPKAQTFKLRPSFSRRRKHLMVAREENNHTKHASTPKIEISSQR